ncbi:hypothetical protein BSL82_16370 [Tardibacter chloracetimidivorans]|uniref:Regulatory protein RecX n=1 Tax=Tardibacter chloracetimidivorans TaxID=1921510 RepID=A0A1L3ZYJ6_9SPHN|nr:RecX family transcriptional regulator [Tardibacter chloracetimidivorans]API60669.1 hypothetical protein BSL82_16370 [Tardibacter chloracetimidivorans]
MDSDAKPGRKGRPPLGPGELDAMALRYVERYATSEEKLARYLRRKLRERGWDGEDAPPVAALVQRLAGLRYVDDRQFAEARTRSLARRGYGRRRIGQALAADGIAPQLREDAAADLDEMESALALARRRRLGPFAEAESGPEKRRKDLGILLRAGHGMDVARRVANAATVEELEIEA